MKNLVGMVKKGAGGKVPGYWMEWGGGGFSFIAGFDEKSASLGH